MLLLRLRAIWALLRGRSVVYGIGFYGDLSVCLSHGAVVAANVRLEPGYHLDGSYDDEGSGTNTGSRPVTGATRVRAVSTGADPTNEIAPPNNA